MAKLIHVARIQPHGDQVIYLFLRQLAITKYTWFKEVNDEYGHLTGDEALKLVAQVIKKRSRAYDGIGRWAGDEFLIVLPGASAEDAQNAAERIVEGIAATKLALPEGGILSIAASAGVATQEKMTGAIALLDDIIQRADEALYRAKKAGGNQVETTWI